jgi:upstream activation factor subunit UAF30
MAMTDTNMHLPSDDEIRQKMEELMKIVDLETMSTKQFIAALSTHFGGVDLSSKKKYIKANITEIIDSMTRENDDDEDSEDESVEEEDADEGGNEIDLKPKKRVGGGGLSAVKEISDELADFLGSGKFMARTAIVKALWNYIKENNLQNPSDKRQILLDDKMKAVFGVDNFTVSAWKS